MPSPLDFPPNAAHPTPPVIGDTWPSPPVAGQPTYQWDGIGWLSKFALGKEYVPLDGSTPMTGLLTLFGDPTTDLQAVPRRYINTNIGIARSYLAGLTLAAPGGVGTFSIAAGSAMDSTNTAMLVQVSSWTKTTGLWVAGPNLGALDTGTSTANTWYHVYLLRRPDTGVIDVCISLSATGPTFGTNIPAAYTQYRRIGAMKTDASLFWTAFIQDGDYFAWNTAVTDVNSATNPGTAAVLRTLSVPLGIRTTAKITANISATSLVVGLIVTDPLTADQTASATRANLVISSVAAGTATSGTLDVRTNTNSQVRTRLSGSDASTVLNISTFGWIDRRGRDD